MPERVVRVQTPESRSVATLHVALPCYEDKPGCEDVIYAPPSKTLVVCVVSDRAFISFNDYDEGSKERKFTETAEVAVDAYALLQALVSQMDVKFTQIEFAR